MLRFLAAVVVVVDLRCLTVPPEADLGAAVALLGERPPEPTEVELGAGGCNSIIKLKEIIMKKNYMI